MVFASLSFLLYRKGTLAPSGTLRHNTSVSFVCMIFSLVAKRLRFPKRSVTGSEHFPVSFSSSLSYLTILLFYFSFLHTAHPLSSPPATPHCRNLPYDRGSEHFRCSSGTTWRGGRAAWSLTSDSHRSPPVLLSPRAINFDGNSMHHHSWGEPAFVSEDSQNNATTTRECLRSEN